MNISISKLAEQYNQFQHAFGQEDSQSQDIINTLFSPKFKKVANGNELVSERTQLLSQLITRLRILQESGAFKR